MKEFFKSEAFRRAVRTFLQTATGYFLVHVMSVDLTIKSAAMGIMAASIAAGIAGIMNIDWDGDDKDENSRN